MAKEIERKFLLSRDNFNNLFVFTLIHNDIKQGYILLEEHKHLRVRLTNDCVAELCLKYTENFIRDEYEYEIPYNDGKEIYDKCTYTVEKRRYVVHRGDLKYEIDEYPNGLLVVEIEIPNKDYDLDLLPWLGEEITGNREYSNISLAQQNLKFN